ncbi:MAG: DUF4126 domain-containing protein [Acidimicrobiia bacterium]
MDLGTAVAGAWSSGISMYAVAAILGIGGRLDWVDSPEFLQRPWVIVAALVLFGVEFVVDKVSYVDSTWDAVHTFIRPAAGAFLLADSDSAAGTIPLAISGGALALLAHGAKSATRLVVNASPEPVSNVVVSFAEDGLVAALMTLALTVPAVAFTIALVLAVLSALLIFFVVRSGRRLLARRRQPPGAPRPDR